MPTTISDLSTEIISQIDHYLYSNNDRLTCLTACSKWYHLFRTSFYQWIRICDSSQFLQFYTCLTPQYGQLVKILDLQQLDEPIKLDDLLLKCPNIQSFHFNSCWNNDKLISMMQGLKLYSVSTLDLQSLIGYRLLHTCAAHLTDLTISTQVPLNLVPIKQLESLSINVHHDSEVSRSDLEYT